MSFDEVICHLMHKGKFRKALILQEICEEEGIQEMIRILFICHGNICRSPMAEFVMKRMAEERGYADKLKIASAATSTEEIWNGKGNPVYPPARNVLSRHGISCAGKEATLLLASDYDAYDLLIGMDFENMSEIERITKHLAKEDGKIRMLLSFAGSSAEVSDPWYTGRFESTYSDVVTGCEALLDFLEECGALASDQGSLLLSQALASN